MKVNGSIITLGESKSLYDFLKDQNYDITRIAVERNGEIVPKLMYKSIMLNYDDTIEVVTFVGGG
ncbi:sulfur carrier protein ThiS [Clostridium sediminicola]|uniref:sulfur carrier protein ThiS n=1 Tax=Clostridium sediminicola TaxID=3114879 RepID=UPI0031F1D9C2